MSEMQAAPPVPAATIIIGRERADQFEMFMVVRHQQIDFASGALVFPGGKANDGDRDPELRHWCTGAGDFDETELALRVAAIRETYEESGILLARPRESEELIPGSRLRDLKSWRKKLAADEISILEFLKSESLRLAVDHLTLFAHWITPELMPKRFDTHFYLAAAPDDQIGVHDGGESVDSVWITPAQALAENESGRQTLIFPTRVNVGKLARYHSIGEAIETARQSRVITVQPWVEERDDGPHLCIPAEADYDLTSESLEKIMGGTGA